MKDIRSLACEKHCPVQRALVYVDQFLKEQMCGRCLPCALGAYEAKIRLDHIAHGGGAEKDLAALRRIAKDLGIGALCQRGKSTAAFLEQQLNDGVLVNHLSNGLCPNMECTAFTEYRIVPEKCIMCGWCKEACGDRAILGKKRVKYLAGYLPFQIRQKRCTKCGNCLNVCPAEAVVLTDKEEKSFA